MKYWVYPDGGVRCKSHSFFYLGMIAVTIKMRNECYKMRLGCY